MQRCESPAQRKRKCSGNVEIISKMAAVGVGKKLQLVTNHLRAGGCEGGASLAEGKKPEVEGAHDALTASVL